MDMRRASHERCPTGEVYRFHGDDADDDDEAYRVHDDDDDDDEHIHAGVSQTVRPKHQSISTCCCTISS